MRRGLLLVLVMATVLLLAGFAVTCSSTEEGKEVSKKTEKAVSDTAKVVPADTAKKVAPVDEVAVLETNYGTMVLEFFPTDAPGHVENFKRLARKGFYDGTKFHRIIKGFMIQGGDPNSKDANPDNDGLGGPGYTIKAEFNKRPHLKGTLSMARGQDPNSAGSQFFICLAPQPGLNNQYTVFGQLIKGMDVLEKIGDVKVKPNKYGENSVPVEAVVLTSVKIIPKAELEKKEKAPAAEEEK